MAPPLDLKVLATSALAFAVALSWNNAVENGIRSLYPAGSAKSAHATTVYAIVVTILVILVVVVINYLSRAAERIHYRLNGMSSPPKEPYGASGVAPKGTAQIVNVNWPSHWM